MSNHETQAARQFHDATKYVLVGDDPSDARIWMGTPPRLGPAIGEQDRAIEPLPYKIYPTLDPLPLPREPAPLSMPALDAVAADGRLPAARAVPGSEALARLCLLSNGILLRRTLPNGRTIEYRAAGGTGARYHLELYLVCGELQGFDAGVYHYAAHDHSLRRLRRGDYRALLAEATGAAPSIVEAPAVIVASSTFWRNAWRYQARAYRHVYWDLGTTLSNLLAVAAAEQLPAEVVLGFAEAPVNRLLGVDGERESAVALVALGRDAAAPYAPAVTPLELPIEPISAREIVFPDLVAMHDASSLSSGAEAARWRRPLHRDAMAQGGERTVLRPLGPNQRPDTPIDTVIRRRRSTRHYAVDAPLPFDAFSTLLDCSGHSIAMDCLDPADGPLVDQYVIVNNVEQLDAGSYVLDPRARSLELLGRGNLRADAERLACAQSYAADAHVNVYYLVDLEPILEHYGNRGYRLAQLEAAIRAGKLHLAAHALGLGAVGSTSADDEVIRLFSPHAAGKSYIFVIVAGVRRPRAARV